MFQWHRILVPGVVVMALSAAPVRLALADPVRVNFTVQGAPNDPVLAGATSTGYFVFDSSLIPFGGGQISANYPPGLNISSVSFDWDGHHWTEADVFSGILNFAPDGSLISWNLQAKESPNYVISGTLDFAFDVDGDPTFSYAAPRPPGGWAGTVLNWDVGVLPILIAAVNGEQGQYLALDSYGRIYSHGAAGCQGDGFGAVSVVGNLFNGPPPHKVIGLVAKNGQIVATLENGDVWNMCERQTVGEFAGNIFSAPGITAVSESNTPRPQNRMAPARPNPFNPSVVIDYTVASAGRVSLRIFDATGRLVRTLEDVNRVPGRYTARWDGNSDGGVAAASGTYFCQTQFGDGSKANQKVTLVR